MNLPRNEFRMSITSSCNMKCTYCHNEGNSQKSILTKENIEKIINAALFTGIEEVRLTGGDPLVHPQIYEICDMIHNKYNLRVSINTNCVAFEKLYKMIKNNLISRVVVGLDYYDAPISKNSLIGISSQEILNRILIIKNEGCDVSISTVFNGDYENKKQIIKWCINNGIRVKVLEIERNEISQTSSADFLKLQKEIIQQFPFDAVIIDELNEYNCYINGKRIVSFFPSLCRLRRCDLCKKIQLRITSNGILKPCLYYEDQDEKILDCDNFEISNRIAKTLMRKINYHIDKNLKVN